MVKKVKKSVKKVKKSVKKGGSKMWGKRFL
jgi:hypothetical protein